MLLAHSLLLLLSFIFLWLGSRLLIKSALTISKILGLSETFIGLTLVSFCLNFPEIMITFSGALKQAAGQDVSQLVVGNVVGSNMGQISLVLGLTGLFQVIKVKKSDVINNGFALIASTLVLFLVSVNGTISRQEGALMVLIYFVYLFTLSKSDAAQGKDQAGFFSFSIPKISLSKISAKKHFRPLVELILGLVVIAFGSEITVSSGLAIAQILNISQLVVGVFIVGLGVSLPELFVAITALRKGSVGLSVGSMLGGNIIVILIALGGTAVFSNWQIPRAVATFDMAYLLLTTVIVVLFLLTKRKLERKESALILLMYVIYALLKTFGY